MRKVRKIGLGALCLSLLLSMAIYSFPMGVARADFAVSKRNDFCTDDTIFATNENIYIKIGVDQVTKLVPGDAKIKVFVRQKGKNRLKEKLKVTITGDKTAVSYKDDVQCYFTEPRAWFDAPDEYASTACGSCHPPFHSMDLTTRAGMLAGTDGGAEAILGETNVGDTDYDWGESILRKRLRNNRMPPGVPFTFPTDVAQNRNGPDVDTTDDGNDLPLACEDCNCETTDCDSTPSDWFVKLDGDGNIQYNNQSGSGLNLVGLISAWVDDAADGGTATYGDDTDVTWCDIAPAFCQPNVWYNGALACTSCHYCGEEPPCFHTLNLCTEAGIKAGVDEGSESILGESGVGEGDYAWEDSILQWRLRNNRMPPNAPFVLDESNRNGRYVRHPVTGADTNAVDLIGEWVMAGCPDN